MNKRSWHLALFVIMLWNTACSAAAPTEVAVTSLPSTATPRVIPPRSCKPTLDDGVSPSYEPNAPERDVVGQGHILTGVLLSSETCEPIANVRLEFWPEEAEFGHPDSARATLFTDRNGHYRFECNPPEHIHMRISAPGFRTIGVNSYHPGGITEGVLDIVLMPE